MFRKLFGRRTASTTPANFVATFTEQAAALSHFLDVFSDGMLANSLAELLSCGELESLTYLFDMFGHADAANTWRELHALGDGEEDDHYQGSDLDDADALITTH